MLRFNQQLWNALAAMGLANIPPAPTMNAILQWSNNGAINANVLEHLQSYLILPQQTIGPYEIHPYIDRESVEFDLTRRYLLLGTFPPSSYMHFVPGLNIPGNANLGPQPNVNFYYGNMASLWRLFNVPFPLNVGVLKSFLGQNSISISDVIVGTQRRDFRSAGDSDLFNIIPNKGICSVFQNSSSIETILFTSGSLASVKIQNGIVNINQPTTLNIFCSILLQCNSDIEISGDVSGNGPYYPLTKSGLVNAVTQQGNRIIWWIKIKDRKWRVINLPTPATSLGMVRTPYFRKWVNFKARQANIPLPLPGVSLNNFMGGNPGIFTPPYTNQYRSEIYNLALNNIPLLNTI